MEIEKRTSRDASLTVRVEASLRREAEAAAAVAGVSLSDLVRAGIRDAARSILGRLSADKAE